MALRRAILQELLSRGGCYVAILWSFLPVRIRCHIRQELMELTFHPWIPARLRVGLQLIPAIAPSCF